MFYKNSRYYKLDDIVTFDSKGVKHKSKTIRRIPSVTGIFQHNIEEGDRLDLLANRYYKKPARWWRICDSNPDFYSPLDLLGDGVTVTTRFEIESHYDVSPFPWLSIIQQIMVLPGIDKIKKYDRVKELVVISTTIGSKTVNISRERFERYLDIYFNRNMISNKQLRTILVNAGIDVSDPISIGRKGKGITIPPIK